MIPSVFAYKLDQAGGLGLIFITLPKILQNIYLGEIFAIILFTAVIFGGITSLQNMFEVVVESFLYRFPRINRKMLLITLCVICYGIGINMQDITSWEPWMDFVAIYIIPIGALIGAFSWFWVLPKNELLNEINLNSSSKFGNLWHSLGKFIYVPLAFILCVIAIFMRISF